MCSATNLLAFPPLGLHFQHCLLQIGGGELDRLHVALVVGILVKPIGPAGMIVNVRYRIIVSIVKESRAVAGVHREIRS